MTSSSQEGHGGLTQSNGCAGWRGARSGSVVQAGLCRCKGPGDQIEGLWGSREKGRVTGWSVVKGTVEGAGWAHMCSPSGKSGEPSGHPWPESNRVSHQVRGQDWSREKDEGRSWD